MARDMASDAAPGDRPSLTALLNANLDRHFDELSAEWCPEIDDPGLRKALFENPRTRRQILDDVLAARGVASVAEVTGFEGEEELRLALLFQKDALALQIGAAWVSNALVDLAGRGRASETFPELSRTALKTALAFRDHAPRKEAIGNPNEIDLRREGALCFAKWVEGLPQDVACRVHFGASDGDAQMNVEEAAQRRALCALVLTSLDEKDAVE